MNSEDFTLLMTACITPPSSRFGLKRTDSSLRVNDYITAFKYWLKYPDSRIKSIVFVENSEYPLDSFYDLIESHNIYRRTVEILKILPDSIPEDLHYGYSELEMMDKAFIKSKELQKHKFIIKVTGRLYFPDLSQLLDYVKPNHIFFSDSRDYNILLREKHFIVTTLLIIDKDFYKSKLLDVKTQMTSTKNNFIEILYFNLIKPLYKDSSGNIVLRFPINVEPVGIGAHYNVNYGSYKKLLPAYFRSISRKYLPGLWI